MADRVSFSQEEQDINDIAEMYNTAYRSLMHYKSAILSGTVAVPPNLVGLSLKELDDYFIHQLEEIGMTLCLNLIAATEARFRKDFLIRVYERFKDDLSVLFRNFYSDLKRQERENRISLEQHILDQWKEVYPSYKCFIGDFKGVLLLRHWLAHGRYWTRKFRKYDFSTVYTVCSNIINNLPLN